MASTMTLRQAVGGIPEASWTDSNGELWTSKQILDQWKSDQLEQPVTWGESALGAMQVQAVELGGAVVLTMEQPNGSEIPSEPSMQVEE